MTNPPTAAPGVAVEQYDHPSEFRVGQWWVEELDKLTANGTDDQKRAMAVVLHLLKSIAATPEEPVGYVRRGHYGGDARNIGFQTAELYPTARLMDGTKLYAHPAVPVRMQELSNEQINLDAVMDLVAKYRAVHSGSPAAEQDAYRAVLAAVKLLATGCACAPGEVDMAQQIFEGQEGDFKAVSDFAAESPPEPQGPGYIGWFDKTLERFSPGPSVPVGAPQEVTDADIDRFLGIYNNTVETTPQQRYQMRKALGDFTSRLVTGALPAPGLSVAQEPKYTVNGHAIVNRASGEAIPADEPVFIFRARDKQACSILGEYAQMCDNEEHRNAVNERFVQFGEFADAHPERMKEPDTSLAATPPSAAPAEVLAHTGDNDVSTATLLDESATMLEDYALHQRDLGNDSTAAGADAHAYRLRHLNVAPPAEPKLTESQVKAMVDRFLGWPLPKTFSPDCGVSFKPVTHSWPVGTNLLTAIEARGMLEYVLASIPPAGEAAEPLTGEMAYHTARGDYEVWQIRKRPRQTDWPKFATLSPIEQAYWVAKTCAAAPSVVQASGEVQGDAARLNHLEQLRQISRARGYQWNTWAFDAKKSDLTIREQLDAAIAANKAGVNSGGA